MIPFIEINSPKINCLCTVYSFYILEEVGQREEDAGEEEKNDEEENDEGDRGIEEQVDDESNLTLLTLACNAQSKDSGEEVSLLLVLTISSPTVPHRAILSD